MRSEYQLKNGRKNPYPARLGPKGRAELLEWWSKATNNLRVLPDDVARAFPDTKTTVEALRYVMKLKAPRSTRGRSQSAVAVHDSRGRLVKPRARGRLSRATKR